MKLFPCSTQPNFSTNKYESAKIVDIFIIISKTYLCSAKIAGIVSKLISISGSGG